MKLIFTKSTAPLSVLIRWGLNEPCSHFAIVFYENFVVHSNLVGVHTDFLNTFETHAEVVHEIEYDPGDLEQLRILKNLISTSAGHGYDYGALLYFMWSVFLFRFFKRPMPRRNQWGSTSLYLCTELARSLPPEILQDLDLAMTSPEQLYLKLKPKA